MIFRLNGLYSVLDEIGTWNASWTEVCDSIHNLAGQVNCLNDSSNLMNAGCYTASQGNVIIIIP